VQAKNAVYCGATTVAKTIGGKVALRSMGITQLDPAKHIPIIEQFTLTANGGMPGSSRRGGSLSTCSDDTPTA
jgi:hypothetical protein